MSTVEEIKAALKQLAPAQQAEVERFLADLTDAAWAGRMDSDAAAGRLEFLFQEGDAEYDAGKLRDWPGQS